MITFLLSHLLSMVLVPSVSAQDLCDQEINRILTPEAFAGPMRKMDDHDLIRAGTILNLKQGSVESSLTKKMISRDGTYVFLIDDQERLVLSHRAPNPQIDSDGKFLATHRGLYQTLVDDSPRTPHVIAAGEFRVVGGQIIGYNNRAGTFYDDLIALMRNQPNPQAERVAQKLKESLASAGNSPLDAGKRSAALRELLKDPDAKAVYEKARQDFDQRAQLRLNSAQSALEKAGFNLAKAERKPFDPIVAIDGHADAVGSARFEIEDCPKNPECHQQLKVLKENYELLLNHYSTREMATISQKKGMVYLKSGDTDRAERTLAVSGFLNEVSGDGLSDVLYKARHDGHLDRVQVWTEELPKLVHELGLKP
jgi:hypothetical protein